MELPEPGRIVSVNLAVVGMGAEGRTGIDKRPTAERVGLRDNHVVGDTIGNLKVHGGYDQAVYAYAREDATWWADELSRDLPPGAFGENLSTEGVDLTGAVIGERWAVGSTVLEVSSPRIPCRVFAGFWGVDKLIKRFTERGWPGAYLRILTEGEVGAGDQVQVIHRPAHGLTIGETFRGLTGERELAPKLLTAPELPASYRDRVETWLATPGRRPDSIRRSGRC
jgi:MOSC domain-containing protein YiiM